MYTLITGASSGIGVEFAHAFAAEGRDLILVARRADRLDRLAITLREQHGISALTLPLDLSRPDAAETLHRFTTDHDIAVDTLVNNAGFATHGDLAEADPARLAQQIQLNCVTLATATARFLPAMRQRGAGTVINVASTAAFQPLPHMAVYGASKAFVLSLTEALWAEERHSGIRVLAICPGATATEFFDTAGEAAANGAKRSPQDVVAHVMRQLSGTKPSLVHGAMNAFVARFLVRILPRRTVLSIAERSVRPSEQETGTRSNDT